MKARRGKILKVKLGVNPNSSSLGSDVIYLMLGTPAVAILVFGLSGLISLVRRKKLNA